MTLIGCLFPRSERKLPAGNFNVVDKYYYDIIYLVDLASGENDTMLLLGFSGAPLSQRGDQRLRFKTL